jgi:LysR family transcriptional activator of nhaA
MDWLNYHHLLYFWMVAREGSITKACAQLHLAQPTISSQLRKLERSLGEKLFEREGRNLVLTETGRTVYRYADEIFALGQELRDAVAGRPRGRPLRLVVGVPDVLPKLIVYRLLKPALEMEEATQLATYEGKLDDLLADLALHRLDIVLSDAPTGPTTAVRAFNHPLGECGIGFFGTAAVARQYASGFPSSLDQAPMLLPTENTVLRRSLEQWFSETGVRPRVVAELEDSALLKVFGQAGEGIFPAPLAIATEVQQQYAVKQIGCVESIRERFYAISVERRLKHPAVLAISKFARDELFEIRSQKIGGSAGGRSR